MNRLFSEIDSARKTALPIAVLMTLGEIARLVFRA